MTRWHLFIVTAACVAAAGVTQAESLRCNGRSTELGDLRLSVLRSCGEPTLRDSFCAPIHVAPNVMSLLQPHPGAFLQCLQVDAWLYDRGPGHLSATVRFHNGIVQSITYGHAPP